MSQNCPHDVSRKRNNSVTMILQISVQSETASIV